MMNVIDVDVVKTSNALTKLFCMSSFFSTLIVSRRDKTDWLDTSFHGAIHSGSNAFGNDSRSWILHP